MVSLQVPLEMRVAIARLYQKDLLEEMGGAGSQLGALAIQLLIFADDVVLLAHTPADLQQHLLALEHFCKQTGMQVNMKKTKCLAIGTKQELSLCFAGEKLEMVTSYKYLVKVKVKF
ncbi:unnamed protein product [Calypogeia fissa]